MDCGIEGVSGLGLRGREGDCGRCKISLLLHVYSVNRGRCTLRLAREAFHDMNITSMLST